MQGSTFILSWGLCVHVFTTLPHGLHASDPGTGQSNIPSPHNLSSSKKKKGKNQNDCQDSNANDPLQNYRQHWQSQLKLKQTAKNTFKISNDCSQSCAKHHVEATLPESHPAVQAIDMMLPGRLTRLIEEHSENRKYFTPILNKIRTKTSKSKFAKKRDMIHHPFHKYLLKALTAKLDSVQTTPKGTNLKPEQKGLPPPVQLASTVKVAALNLLSEKTRNDIQTQHDKWKTFNGFLYTSATAEPELPYVASDSVFHVHGTSNKSKVYSHRLTFTGIFEVLGYYKFDLTKIHLWEKYYNQIAEHVENAFEWPLAQRDFEHDFSTRPYTGNIVMLTVEYLSHTEDPIRDVSYDDIAGSKWLLPLKSNAEVLIDFLDGRTPNLLAMLIPELRQRFDLKQSENYYLQQRIDNNMIVDVTDPRENGEFVTIAITIVSGNDNPLTRQVDRVMDFTFHRRLVPEGDILHTFLKEVFKIADESDRAKYVEEKKTPAIIHKVLGVIRLELGLKSEEEIFPRRQPVPNSDQNDNAGTSQPTTENQPITDDDTYDTVGNVVTQGHLVKDPVQGEEAERVEEDEDEDEDEWEDEEEEEYDDKEKLRDGQVEQQDDSDPSSIYAQVVKGKPASTDSPPAQESGQDTAVQDDENVDTGKGTSEDSNVREKEASEKENAAPALPPRMEPSEDEATDSEKEDTEFEGRPRSPSKEVERTEQETFPFAEEKEDIDMHLRASTSGPPVTNESDKRPAEFGIDEPEEPWVAEETPGSSGKSEYEDSHLDKEEREIDVKIPETPEITAEQIQLQLRATADEKRGNEPVAGHLAAVEGEEYKEYVEKPRDAKTGRKSRANDDTHQGRKKTRRNDGNENDGSENDENVRPKNEKPRSKKKPRSIKKPPSNKNPKPKDPTPPNPPSQNPNGDADGSKSGSQLPWKVVVPAVAGGTAATVPLGFLLFALITKLKHKPRPPLGTLVTAYETDGLICYTIHFDQYRASGTRGKCVKFDARYIESQKCIELVYVETGVPIANAKTLKDRLRALFKLPIVTKEIVQIPTELYPHIPPNAKVYFNVIAGDNGKGIDKVLMYLSDMPFTSQASLLSASSNAFSRSFAESHFSNGSENNGDWTDGGYEEAQEDD